MGEDVKAKNDRIAARLRVQRYRARQRGKDEPLRKPGPRPKHPQATIPAHPGAGRGYALDFSGPIRHVVTELARAGVRGASVGEMAETYRHADAGDLSRVRLWHGLESDAQAERFLIDRAVSALGVQARQPGGGRGPGQLREARGQGRYRLAVTPDDIRYDG